MVKRGFTVTAPAFLLLEDGSIFSGNAFGFSTQEIGEVVFNTTMTGYQEVLTDPSYSGQIVVLTYPLVGNYGINDQHSESGRAQVSGFVVREQCETPSNGTSTETLHEFLVSQQIAGIYGVDTRAITKRLRSQGVMMGVLTHGPIDAAKRALGSATRYDDVDFIKVVTTNKEYRWGVLAGDKVARYRVLVYDYGLKYNILRLLESRGCEVLVVPAETPAKEMLNANIDGILLSPGPGDPLLLDYLVENTKTLLGQIPIMGICLGHQIAARALGAKTFKLKFGHRGGNHPVKDLDTGRIFITSQNHGYAIDASTLDDGCKVSHVNLNDNTVEGLIHSQIPLISIQYHSEASPGPRDNEYMFDRFLGLMEAHKIGKGGM